MPVKRSSVNRRLAVAVPVPLVPGAGLGVARQLGCVDANGLRAEERKGGGRGESRRFGTRDR